LSRSHPVALPTSTAQLQTTTANDLIERINAEATEIQALKATVGIAASVGGSKLGKITEYQEIRGYILAVAEQSGRSMAQVALAWLRHRMVPVIPIIGARKVSQL
jgi:predicted oxidoreductase